MRKPVMSAVLAVVLGVTSTATAGAQQIDGDANRTSQSVTQETGVRFAISPAMARSLSKPIDSQLFRTATPMASSPSQLPSRSSGPRPKLVAGLAFGMIGMIAGAAIGASVDRGCGCDGAGSMLGGLIGLPIGVSFGVWLAAK
jgi:hypothetical protein